MQSVGIIDKIISAEGLKSEQIFVGGFSQGCAMALATFLHHKGCLGGVVGLSGALMSEIDWKTIDVASK